MKYSFIALSILIVGYSSVIFAQDNNSTDNSNAVAVKPYPVIEQNNADAADKNVKQDSEKQSDVVKEEKQNSEKKVEEKKEDKPIVEKVQLDKTLEDFNNKKEAEADAAHTGFQISIFGGDHFKYGADLSYRFKSSGDYFGFRFSYAHIGSAAGMYDFDDDLGNGDYGLMEYNSAKFDTTHKGDEFALLFDFVPFRFSTWGSMYFTLGYYLGNYKFNTALKNTTGNLYDYFVFNGNLYELKGDYSFKSEVERNTNGPYFGLGFDFKVAKNIGFFIDGGVLATSGVKYNHQVNFSGWINGFPTGGNTQADEYLRRMLIDYTRDVEDEFKSKLLFKGRLGLFVRF